MIFLIFLSVNKYGKRDKDRDKDFEMQNTRAPSKRQSRKKGGLKQSRELEDESFELKAKIDKL